MLGVQALHGGERAAPNGERPVLEVRSELSDGVALRAKRHGQQLRDRAIAQLEPVWLVMTGARFLAHCLASVRDRGSEFAGASGRGGFRPGTRVSLQLPRCELRERKVAHTLG